METTLQKLEQALCRHWQSDIPLSIDCGEGWHGLLLNLHEELVQVDPAYALWQVKEKFGGLRFYAEPADASVQLRFRDVIDRYQRMSFSVCEQSGNPGVLMKKNGVFKTLDPSFVLLGWRMI